MSKKTAGDHLSAVRSDLKAPTKKRKKRVQPTKLTLQRCRKLGYQVAVVEKWIPHAMMRKDVWGFGDLLAVDDEDGALLIQASSNSGLTARKRKMVDFCAKEMARWLAAGNRIELWGWHKPQHRYEMSRWVVRFPEVGEEPDPGNMREGSIDGNPVFFVFERVE